MSAYFEPTLIYSGQLTCSIDQNLKALYLYRLRNLEAVNGVSCGKLHVLLCTWVVGQDMTIISEAILAFL